MSRTLEAGLAAAVVILLLAGGVLAARQKHLPYMLAHLNER
jgi:hypothetical protein